MPFAAAMSQHPLATHAVGEVVGEVLDQLGDAPDAAVVFVTGPFAGALEDISAAIRAMLRPDSLIGASAASVLAGDREVESGAAISLFAMRFGPRRRFSTEPIARALRFGPQNQQGDWQVTTAEAPVDGSTLILLADPFSFPVDEFVGHQAGVTVVGGLASAAIGPHGNRLACDGAVFDDGAVGLLLPPGVGATPVVSQGYRPVGEALVVTRSSANMIEEIAGQPALDRLLSQAEGATAEDRSRMARGLHVGVVVDEHKPEFERGDFLIRPVLGADHRRRAVAVGAEIPVGSTIQFQVGDAASADEDLRALLADVPAAAALVFPGTGRGTALFPYPHHDAGVVHQHLDGGAVAGMFCAGEIGPISGQHFVHAKSATMVLFDDPT